MFFMCMFYFQVIYQAIYLHGLESIAFLLLVQTNFECHDMIETLNMVETLNMR